MMMGLIDTQRAFIFRSGLILLLVAAVYGGSIMSGFVWDDNNVIVQNPHVKELGSIPGLFRTEDTAVGSTGYYRPMTYVSFALDWALWKGNPNGFHFTNLLLHMCVVLLLYAVTAALFKKEHPAFVAALIFALHPLAGETVNFLAGGRNTLLSACFALLSLLFYLREKQLPAVACFTVAIFSKEFALLLPVVFLMHDYLLKREKGRLGTYAFYLIPAACYLTLRALAVPKANFLTAINVSDALAAPCLVVRYVVNMVNPLQLKVLYDVRPGVPESLLCLAAIACLAGGVYVFRKHDEVLFSAVWLLLFLLPVINIIPLDSASLMADRYAYFSLMGFAVFLAYLICRCNRRAMVAVVATLSVVFSCVDMRRNGIWKNEAAFFTRMTADAPDKFDGYQNLGMYHYKNGDISKALPYLAAAASKPDISSMFLIGTASVFWKENMPAEAVNSLLKAIALEPGNPEPYLMLIKIYEQGGNKTLAASYSEKAEKLFQGVDRRMARRAVELCREGEGYLARQQLIPAENVFWQSLQMNSRYVPALVGLGRVYAGRGDAGNAGRYFGAALALDPLSASARYNLSLMYRAQGRTVEAEQEREKFREAEAALKRRTKGPRSRAASE